MFKLKSILITPSIFIIYTGFTQVNNSKKLAIGDKLPELAMLSMVNYEKSNIHISEFKGKNLLLDFWGTWCGSCITFFPKLDSLQKTFNEDIQILPVTTGLAEPAKKLLNNINKYKGIKISSVVEDTVLTRLFEYKYVPHYIWIDKNGIIRAITGSNEVTEENLKKFIDAQKLVLTEKKDTRMDIDRTKPIFFINRQVPLESFIPSMLYNSVITRFNQDAGVGVNRGSNFISCPNSPIKQLFQIAFGEFHLEYLDNNRLVLEGFKSFEDSMTIGIYRPNVGLGKIWQEKYSKDNSYCYELAFSDSIVNTPYMFEIMRNDLNKFFGLKGYHAKKESRIVKTLALIRISSEDKLKSKGGAPIDNYNDFGLEIRNLPMDFLITKFQAYFPNKNQLAVADETDYTGRIDIKINADLYNIKSVNEELKRYDLKFVEKESAIDVIVISLKSQSNN